ncbi:phage minor head protein [Sulfurimonas sp.]
MVKFDFNLSPDEAIEYLKNKGFKLSFDYDELKKETHHKAFSVAKVTRADLLNDIHEELLASMKDGRTFKDFQAGLKPKLEKKGWLGITEVVNPRTGEVKTIDVNSRRLRTIFETNTRMAYNVARESAMDELPLSVYRRYVSALLPNTREAHAHMHGIIKHKDDEFWINNSPLNGWGCKCKKTAHSEKQIERKGWKTTDGKISDIAHEDFAYDTRKGNKLTKLSKMDLDASLSSLPTATKNKAYEALSETALLSAFYEKLGVNKGDTFLDKVNDPMIIDDNLFLSHTGHLKIAKRDRHLLLDEMIPTIKDPDEIYLEWDDKASRLIKKMFRYITVDKKKRAMIAIFEYEKDKTQGVSLHLLESATGVEKKRIEKLIYKRESD